MLGESASPQDVAQLRATLGLDRPLLVQYGAFVERHRARRSRHVAADESAGVEGDPRAHAGDHGTGASPPCSWRCSLPFRSGSSPRCARHARRSCGDDAGADRDLDAEVLARAAAGDRVFGVSWGGCRCRAAARAANLVLPAITLGAPLAAILARMTRASVLEELRELYVLAARARGVSEPRAVLAHAFRNSLIPDRHRHRPAVRRGADRRGDHRNDLRLAGSRPSARAVDQRARLSGRAGMHPAHRRDLRRR